MKSPELPSPDVLPFSHEGAVLRDLTSGAWVVDVSDCGPALDRAHTQFDRGVVLVCFGTHAPTECALSDARPAGVPHGVLFDVSPDSSSAARYVERFSELVGFGGPIIVNVRSPF